MEFDGLLVVFISVAVARVRAMLGPCNEQCIHGRLYPYPGDCHRFMQCVYRQWTYFMCPLGTRFDYCAKACLNSDVICAPNDCRRVACPTDPTTSVPTTTVPKTTIQEATAATRTTARTVTEHVTGQHVTEHVTEHVTSQYAVTHVTGQPPPSDSGGQESGDEILATWIGAVAGGVILVLLALILGLVIRGRKRRRAENSFAGGHPFRESNMALPTHTSLINTDPIPYLGPFVPELTSPDPIYDEPVAIRAQVVGRVSPPRMGTRAAYLSIPYKLVSVNQVLSESPVSGGSLVSLLEQRDRSGSSVSRSSYHDNAYGTGLKTFKPHGPTTAAGESDSGYVSHDPMGTVSSIAYSTPKVQRVNVSLIKDNSIYGHNFYDAVPHEHADPDYETVPDDTVPGNDVSPQRPIHSTNHTLGRISDAGVRSTTASNNTQHIKDRYTKVAKLRASGLSVEPKKDFYDAAISVGTNDNEAHYENGAYIPEAEATATSAAGLGKRVIVFPPREGMCQEPMYYTLEKRRESLNWESHTEC